MNNNNNNILINDTDKILNTEYNSIVIIKKINIFLKYFQFFNTNY